MAGGKFGTPTLLLITNSLSLPFPLSPTLTLTLTLALILTLHPHSVCAAELRPQLLECVALRRPVLMAVSQYGQGQYAKQVGAGHESRGGGTKTGGGGL